MQNNNLKNIVKGLLAALVIAIVWFTHSQNVQSPNLGAISVVPTPVALFETTLSNSITSTATTFTLTSATDKDGNTLATSTYAFIIDEGTANEEFVTAECIATACSNAQRGLSVVNGTSEVTANKKAHRRGASVKITDGPQLLILSRLANGTIGYENPLKYSGVSTSTIGLDGDNIASVAYANSLSFGAIAAAAEAVAGFVELATGQEAASSTLSGSFARLVLPTSISTSTAPALGHVIPVTGIDGNISEGFLPTTFTQNYTFSGITTLASTILSGALDANYNITEVTKLSATTTQTTKPTGTGSDETLYAVTIPANLLQGNAVRMKLWLSDINDGNNPFSIKLNYDNTTIASIDLGSINLNDAIDTGYIEAILMGVSTSTTAQKGMLRIDVRDEGQSVAGTELPTFFEQNFGTATEDSATDLVMSVLVNQTAAEASLVLEMATVELIK